MECLKVSAYLQQKSVFFTANNWSEAAQIFEASVLEEALKCEMRAKRRKTNFCLLCKTLDQWQVESGFIPSKQLSFVLSFFISNQGLNKAKAKCLF